MNKTIRVVIIDNGLNKEIYYDLTRRYIKAYIIKDGVCILDDQVTYDNRLNHGTVCASILAHHASNAEIISISIGDHGKLPVPNLESALIWCMHHHIDVISMSIGVTSYLELKQLFSIFKELELMGIIVVAAASNDNRMTYPAALPYVVGVRYVEGSVKSMLINKNPFDGINIEASFPYTDLLKKLREKYQFDYPITNSLVTPYVAAEITNFIVKENRKKTYSNFIDDFGRFNNANFEQCCNYILPSENKIVMLQNISVPLIGLIYDEDQFEKMSQLSILLQGAFCRNGYNCILLSTTIGTNLEDNIFQLSDNKMVSDLLHYFYISVSDIILLHIPRRLLLYYNGKELFDLIIKFELHEGKYNEDNTLIIPNILSDEQGQAEFLYEKIVEIYSEN